MEKRLDKHCAAIVATRSARDAGGCLNVELASLSSALCASDATIKLSASLNGSICSEIVCVGQLTMFSNFGELRCLFESLTL